MDPTNGGTEYKGTRDLHKNCSGSNSNSRKVVTVPIQKSNSGDDLRLMTDSQDICFSEEY